VLAEKLAWNMQYIIYNNKGGEKMEKITMNLEELWYEAFPRLHEDIKSRYISNSLPDSKKIELIAIEIRRLRAEIARETVGRKKRDRELDRLRQLDIIHKAVNYNGRML
jgi:hypothetical protein